MEYKKLIAILFLLLVSAPVFAFKVDGSANIYFTNNSFWRTGGLRDPHMQYDFSLSTSLKNLDISFTPWVNYNLSTKDTREVDYTLDFSYSIIEAISASIGTIYYDVTDSVETGEVPETAEVYGGIEYSAEIASKLALSPGVKFYYDFKEYKNAYLEASLSVETPVFPYISLSSILGYDFGQFELENEKGEKVSESKPTTLQIGISGSYEIVKGITIEPGFTYVIGLHEGFDNTSFAGLRFSFSF